MLNNRIIARIEEWLAKLANGEIVPGKHVEIHMGVDYELTLKANENPSAEQSERRAQLLALKPDILAWLHKALDKQQDPERRAAIEQDIKGIEDEDICLMAFAKLHMEMEGKLHYEKFHDSPAVLELRTETGSPLGTIATVQEAMSRLETFWFYNGLTMELKKPHVHMSIWVDGDNISQMNEQDEKFNSNSHILQNILQALNEGLYAYANQTKVKQLPKVNAGISKEVW